jgi:hypothetical protein
MPRRSFDHIKDGPSVKNDADVPFARIADKLRIASPAAD